MGLEEDQAPIMKIPKIDLFAVDLIKIATNRTQLLSGQGAFLLQRSEEYISSKSRELISHLSMTGNQITIKSTGDSTFKTRICSPISIKQLITVTK
jgi:hypothetical protein